MKDYFKQEIFQRAMQGLIPADDGLHSFTYETDCGLTLECQLEFEEGDPSVGLPDSATLINACVGEYDIFNVLRMRLIDMIEHAFLNREVEWE